MTRTESTLLAFDYGLKRIGVAVGQTLTGTANPLQTVAVKNNRPDWGTIERLIGTWSPDALVVGLPLNMDGTEQEMTDRARQFGRRLHGRYHLPVHLADERLTTREAEWRLMEEGGNTDRDPVAAQIILETWMGTSSSRPAAAG